MDTAHNGWTREVERLTREGDMIRAMLAALVERYEADAGASDDPEVALLLGNARLLADGAGRAATRGCCDGEGEV